MACASKIGCEISATTSTPVPLAADDAVRVAVGSLTGRRSGAWRIWFGPQDIFAGYRSVAHIRKVSIHYERRESPTQLRYIVYTSEWEKSQGRPTRLKDRAHQLWNDEEIASNYFIEFRIRVPECELQTSYGAASAHGNTSGAVRPL
jgi:hypothetical protein